MTTNPQNKPDFTTDQIVELLEQLLVEMQTRELSKEETLIIQRLTSWRDGYAKGYKAALTKHGIKE